MMTIEGMDWVYVVAICFFVCVLVFSSGVGVGDHGRRQIFEDKAVKLGCGKYFPDAEGNPKFYFIDANGDPIVAKEIIGGE